MNTANVNKAELLSAAFFHNGFSCNMVKDDGFNAVIEESYGKFEIVRTKENLDKYFISFEDGADADYKQRVLSFIQKSPAIKRLGITIEEKVKK